MNAEQLARALGAKKKYGRQWKVCCPAHDDEQPSCIIFEGKTGAVQVRCLSAQCSPVEIIAALRRRGLWEGRASDTDRDRQTQTAAKVSHETDALAMRDRARRIFDDAILCHGTMAQRYLESRDIWSVARQFEDIRFHPQCPRGKAVQPAIVMVMRDLVTPSIVQAVQRIYLVDDRKDGTMMLGPVSHAAMMLGIYSRIDMPCLLNVTEGLESALSVFAMVEQPKPGMDQAPVWALGSAGAVERLPMFDEALDGLIIWADHDVAGLRAARLCRDRWWQTHERSVLVKVPEREGWDPADVWRDRCGRQ
jgi:hypothetical protein